MYELLTLIEERFTGTNNIFVFCSNNFWTLFDNIENISHFESFKDRINVVKFVRSTKIEVIKILKYYNDIFKNMLMKKYLINILIKLITLVYLSENLIIF